MSVISADLMKYLEVLKGPMFEHNIPYMYVDSEHRITIGVGHNLTAHKDVLLLAFVVKRFDRHSVKGGDVGTPIDIKQRLKDRKASNPEKQNDFDFLNKHKGLGTYNPDQLAKYTTLELPQKDIDALFEGDLTDAFKIARGEFGPDFDKFPISCRAALIDIAFNVGNFKSFQSNFVAAIKGKGDYAKMSMAERWAEAAKHSKRGKVQSARNDKIAEWLNSGAKSLEAASKD